MCRDSVPGVDPPRSEPEAGSLPPEEKKPNWRRITLLSYSATGVDLKIGRFITTIRPEFGSILSYIPISHDFTVAGGSLARDKMEK